MREGNVLPGLPVRAQPRGDAWAGRSGGARSLGRRDLRKRAGYRVHAFCSRSWTILNKNLEQAIIRDLFKILLLDSCHPTPGGHRRASGGTLRLGLQNKNFYWFCSRIFSILSGLDLEQAGARPNSNISNFRFGHRPNLSMTQLVLNFEEQRPSDGWAISIAVHTGKSMVLVHKFCQTTFASNL